MNTTLFVRIHENCFLQVMCPIFPHEIETAFCRYLLVVCYQVTEPKMHVSVRRFPLP